ncbi:MAG: FAD-binding oxidoreductase [Rubrivivax sp.]|nr:MAG: FAD-binding oxidoreductase [Rubrivivax sp.]
MVALVRLLGPAHVLQGQIDPLCSQAGHAAVSPAPPAELQPYVRDWRQRYEGRALAVALPASTAQVAEVVRLCGRYGVSIVPQGGNTSLVGGSVPDATGRQLVLSLKRLNQILDVDTANLSITVQAGSVLAQVQAEAERAGLLFPLSLAAEGSCTIGGNLATNAGGTQVLRYGTARELCLGLEVVTAQGEIWHGLTALRKDNSGYALRDLFIGSEGTLGIITAASLRLYSRPAGQSTALVACGSLDAAVTLLQQARARLDAGLTAFEVMHKRPLSLVQRHLPVLAAPMVPLLTGADAVPPAWLVLIEHSHPHSEDEARAGLEAVLRGALDGGLAHDATVAQNRAQHRAMWALREGIPSAEKLEGLMAKHDIAVPTSAVPRFAERCEAALSAAFPGSRVVCFGHLGDGNLHYNVQAPDGLAAASFLAEHEAAVHAIVYDTALALGGTISAEHGIGQLRRDDLAARKDPVALQMMRSVKQALDPQQLMNPGRVL